jgi:hypothetical protein
MKHFLDNIDIFLSIIVNSLILYPIIKKKIRRLLIKKNYIAIN